MSRPNYRSLYVVTQALDTIPSDGPGLSWGRSERGNTYLRYASTTNHIPWQVDIYQGSFYRVRVGTEFGEVQRTIPALLGYLIRMLGLHISPTSSV